MLSPCKRQIAHALLTRPPLSFSDILPKVSIRKTPLDLHVLGTPPAFVLSQDQTLAFNPLSSIGFTDQVQLIRNYCLFVCVILVLYRFQGSVPAVAVSRVSKLVYIITPPKNCQHLFVTFFSFFSVFTNHEHFTATHH